MRALIFSLYSLVMLWELTVIQPALLGLAEKMADKHAIIQQVMAEWGW